MEKIPAGPAAAGGAVFDPEHGSFQLGESAGEVVPYHLGRQIAGRLFRQRAAGLGKLLANDHGRVPLGALVDPAPTANTEPVAGPVVHVLVPEVHLVSLSRNPTVLQTGPPPG